MAGHRVAVVGATGAVGQTTLRILEERKFPVSELRAFASERSVGKTVTFKGEPIRVEKVDAGGVPGRRRSRSSPPGSAQSKEYAPAGRQGGRGGRGQVERVPDGSRGAAGRARDQRPRRAAATRASWRARTARPSSRSCRSSRSTTPARLRRVVATSYQAVSGAGVQGVEELRQQTLAWARGEAITAELLPAPDRLQRDPAHRQVRRRRVHGRGDEAGQRGPEDPRAARACPSRRPRCGCPCSRPTPSRSTPRPRRRSRSSAPGSSSRRFPGLRVWDEPAEKRYPMPVTVEGQDDCFVGRDPRGPLPAERGSTSGWWATSSARGRRLNGVQIAELIRGAAPGR